jgi:hypothetical protein
LASQKCETKSFFLKSLLWRTISYPQSKHKPANKTFTIVEKAGHSTIEMCGLLLAV